VYGLEGILVLDLTVSISGPFCTRLLGDWGARVIKVEAPGRGDLTREWDSVCRGLSAAFVWTNRNKESLTLNLKTPEGRQILLELAERADIVVENLRPGTVERLGVGYADVRARNPRVIYGHISGYGHDGPYAEMKAFDLLVQGETGILSLTGTAEEMAKVPLSICDLAAGMYLANAIVVALYHRSRSGQGQEIRVSMFDAMMDWLGYFPYFYWHRGHVPGRVGTRHHLLTPYGPYATADGKAVNIAVLSQEHWVAFCTHVVSRPEWLVDARFASNEARVANRQVLEELIAAEIRRHSQSEWIERLRRAGVPFGVVRDLPEVLAHPRLQHTGQIVNVDSPVGPLPCMDNPVHWSDLANRRDRIPALGEHTDRILTEMGFTAAEIRDLRARGVV